MSSFRPETTFSAAFLTLYETASANMFKFFKFVKFLDLPLPLTYYEKSKRRKYFIKNLKYFLCHVVHARCINRASDLTERRASSSSLKECDMGVPVSKLTLMHKIEVWLF